LFPPPRFLLFAAKPARHKPTSKKPFLPLDAFSGFFLFVLLGWFVVHHRYNQTKKIRFFVPSKTHFFDLVFVFLGLQ
jgi:hypothetical protein